MKITKVEANEVEALEYYLESRKLSNSPDYARICYHSQEVKVKIFGMVKAYVSDTLDEEFKSFLDGEIASILAQ